jgi:hypothetical protein
MKKNGIFISILFAVLTIHCSLFTNLIDDSPNKSEDYAEGSEANPPVGSTRNATITDVIPTVESRDSGAADFAPANTGESVNEGGQVRTRNEGKAKIEIFPEQTIVRISNNTTFTLSKLHTDGTSPTTSLQLILGNLWIILNGGVLKV